MLLSMLAYNLHGFCNVGGFPSCKSNYTIVCVQEHWLQEGKLAKILEYFSGYGCIFIFCLFPKNTVSLDDLMVVWPSTIHYLVSLMFNCWVIRVLNML